MTKIIRKTKGRRLSNEELHLEAKKYIRRVDFQRYSNSQYKQAYRRGAAFMDEICSHMELHWEIKWDTFDKLKKEALKYSSRGDFGKYSASAYGAALLREDYEIVCDHMSDPMTASWSKDELLILALTCKTKTEFARRYPGAYEAALYNFNIDEICPHMPKVCDFSGDKNPNFKWDDSILMQECRLYKTRTQLAKKNSGAYYSAINRADSERFFSHMLKSSTSSMAENELFTIIKTNNPTTKKYKDMKVKIEGKPYIHGFEVDMYVPEFKLGIEFDGTRYHSYDYMRASESKRFWSDDDIRNYHALKDEWFWTSQGIKILHIKEEDWIADKQTCIKRCLDFLGGSNEERVA